MRRGGDWDLVLRVAVWGVAAGIVGARAYHVAHELERGAGRMVGPASRCGRAGSACGAGSCSAARRCLDRAPGGPERRGVRGRVAPGLLIAQGIGRIGNWWNQELFGKPTDLPWALEIDPEHRAAGYEAFETFHPTFLYEFIYDIGMAGVLILIGWRFRIRPPGLFALYVAVYCFGRFFEELLRIDPAHEFGPLRLNALGVGGGLHPLDGVLHLVAVLPGTAAGPGRRA